MLPPSISIKNALSVRSVCSVVLDKVVYEMVDSTEFTSGSIGANVGELLSYTNPTDILYVVFVLYFIQLYISEHTPKRAKQTELHVMVLSEEVYRGINAAVFALFLLVKNPLNAI